MRRELFGVTDAFAEFGIARRPLLDRQAIDVCYHGLAALRHPDRLAGDQSPLTRLNEARRILLSDQARLLHLLHLTYPEAPAANSFSPDFEIFSLVGNLENSTAAFVQKYGQTDSPIAKALLKTEAVALEKAVREAGEKIDALGRIVFSKIQDLDSRWPDVTAEELARVAAESAFFRKWNGSLRKSSVSLLGG